MDVIVNWEDTASDLDMILDIDEHECWFLAPRSTLEADHCCEGLFSNDSTDTSSDKLWTVRCMCGKATYFTCPEPGARFYISEGVIPEPDVFKDWYSFWFGGRRKEVEVGIEWK